MIQGVGNKILIDKKQQSFSYNLFIGGVSSTITSATILASYFTFTEAEVELFAIVGDDVFSKITNTSYGINNSAFSGNLNMTYFKETAGFLNKALGETCFRGINDIPIEIVGNPYIRKKTFSNFGAKFISASNIKIPNMRSNVELFDEAFSGVKNNSGTLDLSGFTTIPNATNSPFLNVTGVTIDMPNVTSIVGLRFFKNCYSTINLPNCTNLGTDATMFTGCNSSTVLNIHQSQATINGGNPPISIQNLTSQGGVVNYI